MDFTAAMRWTQQQMSLLADGGTWVIPRSGTMFRLESRERREVSVSDIKREEVVQDVLRALGWRIIDMKEKKRASKNT